MSAGDIAMAREEYDKAITAYINESTAAGTEGDHAHNALVRAMVAANKLPQAQAEVTAWAASAPANAWQKASQGELLLREGDIAGAYTSLQSAIELDPCNPQAHAALARIYELSAMFLAASSNFYVAHGLDPADDDITRRWIFSLPKQKQLDELSQYISRSDFLTDGQRTTLARRQKRLGLALSDPCRLSTGFSTTAIPFYSIENGSKGRIYGGLLVTINGKPFRLLFDSLISGVILSKSAADRLKVQPEVGADVEGVGSMGDVTNKAAKVDTIAIGPLTFNQCDIQIATNDFRVDSRDHIGTYTEYGSDGLIGPDAFCDVLVTLDMPGHELRLDALPEPGGGISTQMSLFTGVAPSEHPQKDRVIDLSMKNWSQIFRDDQFLIVPAKFKQGTAALYGIATSSILDSISLGLANRVASVALATNEMPQLSNKGSGVFYETSATSLAYAGIVSNFEHMSALDNTTWSIHHGLEIGGFLGRPILRTLTIHIDYRDNLLRLEYDPKRVTNCRGVNIAECY